MYKHMISVTTQEYNVQSTHQAIESTSFLEMTDANIRRQIAKYLYVLRSQFLSNNSSIFSSFPSPILSLLSHRITSLERSSYPSTHPWFSPSLYTLGYLLDKYQLKANFGFTILVRKDFDV